MARLLVATMNILNLADRWDERLPLLLADMAALRPDLIGLNEVVYPMQQDRLLGAAGEGRYKAVRGWAGRPEYGNSLLARASLVATDHDRLDLGMARSAHRVRITLSGGTRLLFAVTHLHNTPGDQEVRLGQVGRLLEWLDAAPEHDALILVGDFNADPREPAYAAMGAAGFTSAYAAANGAEPPVTWPSGLQAPAMDTDGEPRCIDYIWVRGAVEVKDARLVFDRPAVGDPTLFPSDHFGIAAHVRVGQRSAMQASDRPMLRLAHRGDTRAAPENTVGALLAAMDVPGCDGVEFDVRLSMDGVPVLLHDKTLERVQGRPGRVDGMTAVELSAAGVPALAEVLAALPARAFLNAELKGDDHDEATATTLRAARGEAGENAVISSFEPATLVAMAAHLPGWKRWLIARDLGPATISLALELGCVGVSAKLSAVKPASVRAARAAGLDVVAWSVRRHDTFDRLTRLGVVACCVADAALDW